MTTILEFKLTAPPVLARRQPGRALAAEPVAPLLMRHVEQAPPDDELLVQVLEALRRW